MAAVELEWIPETLYNTAISAVVDNYIRSRRDIRSLPENIQFAVTTRTKIIAVVGIANMDPKQNDHTEYPISNIIIHEDYNNNSKSHNIALLKTESAIRFNNLVQDICFLGKKLHKPPSFKNCWVSGWNPTSAVNAILLLEEAVCVLAVGGGAGDELF